MRCNGTDQITSVCLDVRPSLYFLIKTMASSQDRTKVSKRKARPNEPLQQDKTQTSSKDRPNDPLPPDIVSSATQAIEKTDDDTSNKSKDADTSEGSWGYAIVASVFMANFSLLGWFQMQSFFFVEWKREFNTTSVEASMLVSIGLVILGIASK